MKNKSDEKREPQVFTKEKFDFKTLIQPSKKEFQVAGKSVIRTDALLKATGKLAYGADYPEEGFLKGKILTKPLSPCPDQITKCGESQKFTGCGGRAEGR